MWKLLTHFASLFGNQPYGIYEQMDPNLLPFCSRKSRLPFPASGILMRIISP